MVTRLLVALTSFRNWTKPCMGCNKNPCVCP